MSENEMTGNIFYFAGSEAKSAPTVASAETAKSEDAARLVERACAGDGEAFGELYKIFAPMVHGIVLARLPRGEIDDAAQKFLCPPTKICRRCAIKTPSARGWR